MKQFPSSTKPHTILASQLYKVEARNALGGLVATQNKWLHRYCNDFSIPDPDLCPFASKISNIFENNTTKFLQIQQL